MRTGDTGARLLSAATVCQRRGPGATAPIAVKTKLEGTPRRALTLDFETDRPEGAAGNGRLS